MKKVQFLIVISIMNISLYAQPIVNILTTQYPPFQMHKEDLVIGISTDIVRAVLNESNIEGKITVYPWLRAKLLLNSEKPYLFYNMSKTIKREPVYHWIADITPTNIYLWKLKSRKDIVIKNIQDIKPYTIGILKNTVSHKYLLKKGIRNINFSEVTINKQNISKLFLNRIDVMPLDEMVFLYTAASLGYTTSDFEKVLKFEEISNKSYLVANKNMSTSRVEDLKNAWNRIKEKKVPERIKMEFLIKNSNLK